MGLQGINNAAAAGGMLGTPQNQQQAGELATQLANQDFYNYLSKALGTYNTGLQGQQGLYNTGANASMGLGQNMASILGGQAGLAYKGQQEQNKYNADTMGNIIGAGTQMLPFLL
jgi:hypothetical protein